MKKIKNPWYSVVWIVIWTAAVIWFVTSGRFSRDELIGLVLAWLIMVGVMGYFLVQYLRLNWDRIRKGGAQPVAVPARNSLCPCGSGKKYKRCCGQAAGS